MDRFCISVIIMKLIVILGLILVLLTNQSHQCEDDEEEQEQSVSDDPGILNTHQNLTTWAMREEMIYNLAKERRKGLGRGLRVLEKFIEDYEASSLKVVKDLTLTPDLDLDAVKDRAKLVGMNGIASYRMTFRYLEYLEGLRRIYEEGEENQMKTYFNQLKGEWPKPVDLISQMIAFIHVQDIYDFPLDQLSSILSPESEKPIDLSALLCYQIGLLALQHDHFYQSIEWLEFAKRKVIEDGDESCSPVLIENALDSAIRTHNRALKTSPNHLSTLYIEPVVKENSGNNDKEKWDPKYLRFKRRDIQIEFFKGLPDRNFNKPNFRALCSDYDSLQKDEIKARLFCFYDREKSPYWYIGPMKVEHISLNPPVMLVHEILTDSEIFKILYGRDDWFERSLVYRFQDRNSTSTTHQDKQYEPWVRSSVEFWLPNEFFPKLSRKIEHMTGLRVQQGENDSEHLQVLEYVFGRFYGPHRDTLGHASKDPKRLEKLEADGGDFVATVQFYLNSVEHGGATPFVNLGISVPPVKGNAIIWYHLWRNGTIMEGTYHGGCPVLYGVKRVANKRMRYNAQFQTYKCSLNQLE